MLDGYGYNLLSHNKRDLILAQGVDDIDFKMQLGYDLSVIY